MGDSEEIKTVTELETLRAENRRLRAQLKSVGLELDAASVLSNEQSQRILDLDKQSIVDAEQIRHQSDELDLARKTLVLQAELEATNKELETFSYSVSHDLRSPLRAINGFAKALAEDYGDLLPDEGKRYLEHIENSAVKMGNLIDDLLTFSRLSRLDLTKGAVDMDSLARSVWSEVCADYPGREIIFRCESLPKILVDRTLIKQVLSNLFQNAAKFTAPRPVAHVNFTAAREGDEFVFCVQDDGVGFDKKYSDKLFGPFQRLHKAKDFPGTGIGLALVQRIIHRHGGRVWADSTLGSGASFFFTIPAHRDD